MKRVLIALFVLSLFIFVSSGIFALSCSIQSTSCSGTYELMRVSDATNAHGANITSNPAGYKYVCCDTPGSSTCSADGSDADSEPDNKVLGLSSITNAHAEIPSLNNYAIDICYGDLSCTSAQTTCPAGKDAILSLSSADTNAHIGASADYITKICCSTSQATPPTCELTDAYWSIDSGTDKQAISSGYSALTGQTVYLVVKGTDCSGQSISFNILEDDSPGATEDGDVVTLNPSDVSFSGGEAVADWITEYHGDGIFGDPEYKFIATLVSDSNKKINSEQDNYLLEVRQESVIDYCSNSGNPVVFCGSYYNNGQTKENACRNDICDVSYASVGDDVDCSADDIDCFCSWVPETEGCFGSFNTIDSTDYCGDGIIQPNPEDRTGENCDLVFNPGESLCTEHDSYTPVASNAVGTIGCSEACNFIIDDPQYCQTDNPTCGDGVINQNNEECDGDDFGISGNLCTGLGFTSGTMTCSTGVNGCKLVKTACLNPLPAGACGDGVVDSPNSAGINEQCDGASGLSGNTCSSVSGGFYDDNIGTLSCSGFCRYDVGLCELGGTPVNALPRDTPLCGSGIIDSFREECDISADGNLEDFGIFGNDENNCASLGFTSGSLGCSNVFRINSGACVEPTATDSIKGRCTITPTGVADDCADGQISYSWIATWTPGTQTERPASCPSGTQQQVLQCPSQVQLPFFDELQFIITALTISVIYAIMIFRHKKRKNNP